MGLSSFAWGVGEEDVRCGYRFVGSWVVHWVFGVLGADFKDRIAEF